MEPEARGDDATVAGAGEAAVVALLAGADLRSPAAGRATAGDGDAVGNGDDAAVFRAGDDDRPDALVVASTDMLVEGTHFRLDLTTWRAVGRRAIAQNVSDIAAMGARCTRVLVAVALRPDTPLSAVRALAAGLHVEARRYGAAVVGGDVTSAPIAVVTVTALGGFPDGGAPIRLGGGSPGDVLALTGVPGRAQAGLDLLLAGHHDGPLQDAHRVPEPPVAVGEAARLAGATAMTDVTDGLLRDLGALAAASGAAAELDSSRLPADPEMSAAAEILGRDDVPAAVRAWALDGGEDHGLLAAFPAGRAIPAGFTAVGRLAAGNTGEVRVDGRPVSSAGWDSARAAAGGAPGPGAPRGPARGL